MPPASAAESLPFDEALLLLPQRGVDDVRVRRIDAHVVARSCTRPCRAPSRSVLPPSVRAEDAALRVRPVRMAERGDEEPIGIASDRRRCIAIIWLSRRPRCVHVLPASVDLYMPSPVGKVGADDARAAADVDDVRIRRRHGDRADRAGGLARRRSAPSSSRSRWSARRRRCRSRRRRRSAGSARRRARGRARRASGRCARQCMSEEMSAGCAATKEGNVRPAASSSRARRNWD